MVTLKKCTRCERLFGEYDLLDGLCGMCGSNIFSERAVALAKELRGLSHDADLYSFILRIARFEDDLRMSVGNKEKGG